MSRFEINPGPLKIVKRRELATEWELRQSVRCKADTKDHGRCSRLQAPDRDYCWQHALLLSREDGCS